MRIENVLMMMGGEGQSGSSQVQTIAMFALIGVIMYFTMIRPQSRRAKEQKKFREGISKGDKVITIGGVHGKVIEMDDNTVILEMIDKARVKVERAAISVESTMALANRNGAKKDDGSDKSQKTEKGETA